VKRESLKKKKRRRHTWRMPIAGSRQHKGHRAPRFRREKVPTPRPDHGCSLLSLSHQLVSSIGPVQLRNYLVRAMMLGGVLLKNKPIPGTKPNKPYLPQPLSFRENEKHNGRIQITFTVCWES